MTKIEIQKAKEVILPPAPPGWIQTASGRGVDLDAPDPEAVNWNDIAVSLSLSCRFNGHMADLDSFYSVAQHSVLVADLMHPSIAVYGLLHDAHEAYWGDDVTPKKRLLTAEHPDAARWLEGMKAAWDAAIWQAAGVPAPTDDIRQAVRDADMMALAIEHRCLQNAPADPTTRLAWAGLPDASRFGIIALPPRQAHGIFLERLNDMLWPLASQEGTA